MAGLLAAPLSRTLAKSDFGFGLVRLWTFQELLVVLPMFRVFARREQCLILSPERTWGASTGAGTPVEFVERATPSAFLLNRQNGKTIHVHD
jgi:hypothetical protein